MKIEILSIGNEVVSGDILNTNAAWLSEELGAQGFEPVRHLTIADDEGRIGDALLEAPSLVQAVIVTGGLGPTVDDFTLGIAGKVFGLPLKKDPGVMEQLEKFYAARNRTMTPNQEKQAMIPEGAEIFHNPVGSAPGVRLEFQGTHYFFMPGVPKEMKEIFQNSILPWLLRHRGSPVTHHSVLLRCFGAVEAKLDFLLQPLLKDRVKLGEAQIAFRVSFPEIFIKVNTGAPSSEEAEKQLKAALDPIRKALAPYLYGEGDETLEHVVGQLLLERKMTLATAESCTGGLIAHRITNVPGSSRYFLGGIVTYSNFLKKELLGVKDETLQAFGAVSAQTAIEMAEGLRLRLKADMGVSVTGIAGPTGGTEEKPVGTAHMALSTPMGTEEKKFYFPLDRERFKGLVSAVALNWIRKKLLALEN
jgi:nicotinamide-nucleotide amidase